MNSRELYSIKKRGSFWAASPVIRFTNSSDRAAYPVWYWAAGDSSPPRQSRS
jgi:hypothetical protein